VLWRSANEHNLASDDLLVFHTLVNESVLEKSRPKIRGELHTPLFSHSLGLHVSGIFIPVLHDFNYLRCSLKALFL
jgi:hypothetical protein